jgi:hypothetical protein
MTKSSGRYDYTKICKEWHYSFLLSRLYENGDFCHFTKSQGIEQSATLLFILKV